MSSDERWLSKAEVNEYYYGTAVEQAFPEDESDAQPLAIALAKLIASHTQTLPKRQVRILEVGAGNCTFARSLLDELETVADGGFDAPQRIDYVAVDLSRVALESAAVWESTHRGIDQVIIPSGAERPWWKPGDPRLVAIVTRKGSPTATMRLIHGDANRFAAATSDAFDVVILKELLAELPCRVVFADAEGTKRELVLRARLREEFATVKLEARPLEEPLAHDEILEALSPSSLSSRSEESVELVRRLSRLLEPGGFLVAHDRAVVATSVSLSSYLSTPGVPEFVRLDLPLGAADTPGGFFRLHGDEESKAIRITNDVNYAELVEALAATGSVVTVPFAEVGSATVKRADGVFLTEIGLLEPDDALAAILAALGRTASDVREYPRDRGEQREAILRDLVYRRQPGRGQSPSLEERQRSA